MMQCQTHETLLLMTMRFLGVLYQGLLGEFADDVLSFFLVHVLSFISDCFLFSLFWNLIVLFEIVGKGMPIIKL